MADAHVLALEYLLNGGNTNYFNLGTKEGCTVKEVFNACEKVTGKTIPLEICKKRPGDPACLVADNTKAKEILKWQPKHSLKDSISSVYKYIKNMCRKTK